MLLRFVRRRTLAMAVGLALIIPAAWVEFVGGYEAGWAGGLGRRATTRTTKIRIATPIPADARTTGDGFLPGSPALGFRGAADTAGKALGVMGGRREPLGEAGLLAIFSRPAFSSGLRQTKQQT